MKAFIEVDKGTTQRPIYNEQTLEYVKTKSVYKPYPYAYGFLLDTISGDGDHLDCYVITSQPLISGKIVEVKPLGMVESTENGEEDHKILCSLVGEKIIIDSEIEENILDFGKHYFDDKPEIHLVIGRFLGYSDAMKLIDSCTIANK